MDRFRLRECGFAEFAVYALRMPQTTSPKGPLFSELRSAVHVEVTGFRRRSIVSVRPLAS